LDRGAVALERIGGGHVGRGRIWGAWAGGGWGHQFCACWVVVVVVGVDVVEKVLWKEHIWVED
jgi:hypothetical protein